MNIKHSLFLTTIFLFCSSISSALIIELINKTKSKIIVDLIDDWMKRKEINLLPNRNFILDDSIDKILCIKITHISDKKIKTYSKMPKNLTSLIAEHWKLIIKDENKYKIRKK